MNIADLTKKSIQTIARNGDAITPLIFFDTFCGEARRNKVAVEDCGLISTYISKLDKEFQNESNRYNIRNIKEFLSYLTSALNRMNQNNLAKRHHSLFELTKKISETVSMIDNKKLEDLSGRTNGMLERGHSPENLDEMRRDWAKFSFEYKKDRNRKRLSKYISIDKEDDLDSVIDKLIPLLDRADKFKKGENLVDIMFKSATPSLIQLNNKDFDKLYKNLRANPDKIYEKEIQDKLNKFSDERIEADRNEEKKSLQESSNIIKSLVEEQNENNHDVDEKISKIKNDLNSIVESEDTDKKIEKIESINNELDNISQKSSGFFNSIKQYSKSIFDVKEKVNELENSISKKRKEIDRDLLTNLKNKKGFEYDLEDIEKEFKENNENYSVVVIDIDEFKTIVSRFGNDAGDLILRYFSKILKEYISIGDSTARYGEDIFIVSLPNKGIEESFEFISKFKEKVKHTKFIYKSERVTVTFSAGIADRENVEDSQYIMDKATENMNIAKKSGKNQIFPKG